MLSFLNEVGLTGHRGGDPQDVGLNTTIVIPPTANVCKQINKVTNIIFIECFMLKHC